MIKIRKNSITIIITFLFVVYLTIIVAQGLLQNRSVLKRYESLKGEIAQEEALNRQLKLRIKELNTDAFIELLARKKLGLVKPGEIAYKIVE